MSARQRFGDGATDLHRAARDGDLSRVEGLVREGASVAAADRDGRTALFEAASYGHLLVMEHLLACGADPTVEDRYRETPIHRATDLDPRVIMLLVRHGADPNARDVNGNTVLGRAVMRGHFALVRDLVAAGADPDPCDPATLSPLQEAASNGFFEIARWLLEHGANANHAGGRWRTTPLMEAARAGRVEIITLLLDRGGADLWARDQYAHTALHWAAAWSCAAAVRELVVRGAAIEDQDSLGFTPLMAAAGCAMNWKPDGQCLETVAILIEAGANTDVRDRNGWSALHHAANDGHAMVAGMLLSAGANPRAKSKARKAPLDLAVAHPVRHPYEDRVWIVPARREEDPFYGIVATLLAAERKIGLHPGRLAALRRHARVHRCPEVLALLGEPR